MLEKNSFKKWLQQLESFGQGQVGMAGTGLLPKNAKKRYSKTIVLPRNIQQDRHTADRLDPGA